VIDKERLLAWLRNRSQVTSPLVGGIYQGLAERVDRGDFDEEDDD
jgi:hypothetical protein